MRWRITATGNCGRANIMSELLIVDDHPILRQGLAQLLSSVPDVTAVQQAGSGSEAMEKFRAKRPSAVILDLSLGEESGIDVLRRMQNVDPDVPVLVLSMHDENVHAERVLRAGARGYVMKFEATENVISAVRRILAGELVFSRGIQNQIMMRLVKQTDHRPDSGIASLSDKELEVLRLIGMGLATSQIAIRLSRSIKTVEAHRASIRTKLGLASGFELARYAMHWINE
jgi:DNA-binding NarL/FixJ family response regulator